jgi:hypothetical protein
MVTGGAIEVVPDFYCLSTWQARYHARGVSDPEFLLPWQEAGDAGGDGSLREQGGERT